MINLGWLVVSGAAAALAFLDVKSVKGGLTEGNTETKNSDHESEREKNFSTGGSVDGGGGVVVVDSESSDENEKK